jgi:hypothetical protein
MFDGLKGNLPLHEYPWKHEIDRIANWVKGRSPSHRAFIFDVCMSLAYIDSTSGLERSLECCDSCPDGFNAHVGFINLCSPCYERHGRWQFQKAVKPQSGALGKLSSEMLLKFVEVLFPEVNDVRSVGGAEVADAVLTLKGGRTVVAEVKCAPLLTFPLLASFPKAKSAHGGQMVMTSSQFRERETALYMHNGLHIPLGKPKSENWPFAPVASFFVDGKNDSEILSMLTFWEKVRDAYSSKNRETAEFYIANASGSPPKIAKERDGWPSGQSISDSKTSAGLDRTDDIKKGIYQVMKIGLTGGKQVSTALISNLPAYRHASEYIDPFRGVLYGREEFLQRMEGEEFMARMDMRPVFDHLITLLDTEIECLLP